MKKPFALALVAAFALNAVVTKAHAQSRVDQAVSSSQQERAAKIQILIANIEDAELKLAQLGLELDRAEDANPAGSTARIIKKSTLIGVAASVIAIGHGLTHWSNGQIMTLPGVGFFYGGAGLATSGVAYMAAASAEAALTSDDVKIVRGKIAQASKELKQLKKDLKNIVK